MEILVFVLIAASIATVATFVVALDSLKESNTFDAFISYSDPTKFIAKSIACMLRERGRKVWFFPEEVLPGDKQTEVIESALGRARTFVILVDPKGLTKYQRVELKSANLLLIRIIPIAIKRSKKRFFINDAFPENLHWIEFEEPFREYDKVIDLLVRGIEGKPYSQKQFGHLPENKIQDSDVRLQ